jgi:hypothetical protein
VWSRINSPYDEEDAVTGQMIGGTEREIFDESTGGDDLGYQHDQIVHDNSRMHDWDDNWVDDSKLIGEATGDRPIGSTMAGLDEDEARELIAPYEQENAALRARLAQLEPEPVKPDMFADPEGYEEWLLQAKSGVPAYAVPPSPVAKPDMFADPEGWERWVINEATRRSGHAEHNHARFNSQMQQAAELYGDDFQQAWQDITSMDQNDPSARQAIQTVVNSPNPGAALMSVHAAIRGANWAAQQYGSPGPAFAPMIRSSRPRGYGRAMESRGFSRNQHPNATTRDEAEELEVFDSAWD